jgi:hypothetical protein
MPPPVHPPVTLAGVVEVLLQVGIVGALIMGAHTPLLQTCRFFRDVVKKYCRKFLRAERIDRIVSLRAARLGRIASEAERRAEHLISTRDEVEVMAALVSVSSVTVVDMGDVAIARASVRYFREALYIRIEGRNPEAEFRQRSLVMNRVRIVFGLFFEHRYVVLVCIEYLQKFFNSARRYNLINRFQTPELMSLVERAFERYMQDRLISMNIVILCRDLLEQDALGDMFEFPVHFPVVILRCLKYHLQNSTALMRLDGLFVLYDFNTNLRYANVLVENDFIEYVLDVARLHPEHPEINRMVASILGIACQGQDRTNAINRVRTLGAMDILVQRSRFFSNNPFIVNSINSTLRIFTELGLMSNIPNT